MSSKSSKALPSRMPQRGYFVTDHWKTLALKPLFVLSGGIAGCTAEFFSMPLDTLKVRAMTLSDGKGHHRLPVTSNSNRTLNLFIHTFRNEGLRGFYGGRTGLSAAFQRQTVMASVKFGCYELVKAEYCNLFGVSKDPKHTPVFVKILSSATTGGLAVLIGQPTDVVKVRVQANPDLYRSTLQAYREIHSHEGVTRGLWRGTTPGVLRNMVVNMAEIGLYDIIKGGVLRNNLMEDKWPCFVFCSVCTGIAATIVSSPVDVVKTVYSNSTENEYKGLLDCCQSLWKENGIRSYYRGVGFNGSRLILWNMVMFVSLESLRGQIGRQREKLEVKV